MIDSQRWAGTQAAYRGGQLSNFLRPEDRPRSWLRGLGVPNNGIVTRPQCIRNKWFRLVFGDQRTDGLYCGAGTHAHQSNSCNVNQLDLLLAFGFVIVTMRP